MNTQCKFIKYLKINVISNNRYKVKITNKHKSE